MEIVPCPPCGLHQHTGFDVGNVDAPLDAWRLLEQHALICDARIRVWSTIRTELLGAHRCRSNAEQYQNECREAKACEKRHDNHLVLIPSITASARNDRSPSAQVLMSS